MYFVGNIGISCFLQKTIFKFTGIIKYQVLEISKEYYNENFS